MREIKFQGKEFLLIGDKEGAIATKKQYQNGECSYAHLFTDGKVRRFGEVIGARKDIKFGKEVNITPTDKAILNVLMGWG